jgi:hypothetical protein
MEALLQQLIELQTEQNQLLKRYLWRLRFSLSTLLLLTTALCCGLGFVAYRQQSVSLVRPGPGYVASGPGYVSYSTAQPMPYVPLPKPQPVIQRPSPTQVLPQPGPNETDGPDRHAPAKKSS